MNRRSVRNGRGHPTPSDLVDLRRRCFATHLLEGGYNIWAIQELLVHPDLATTMVYTHVLNRGPAAVRSPADRLPGS
jgi:site-specific recombinase XerC